MDILGTGNDLIKYLLTFLWTIMSTASNGDSNEWVTWLGFLGLEEYLDCGAVTDRGSAVIAVVFDWLYASLTEQTDWLGLSERYDECSPDF